MTSGHAWFGLILEKNLLKFLLLRVQQTKYLPMLAKNNSNKYGAFALYYIFKGLQNNLNSRLCYVTCSVESWEIFEI